MRRMAAAIAVLVAFGALVAPARRALAVGTVRVDVGDASVTEGDSGRVALRFVVTLSEPASTAVTMSYAAGEDTSNPDHASALDDFRAKAGTVTFAAGQVAKAITVQVNGDVQPENNEFVSVSVSNIANATPGDTSGTGTIVDDDHGSPAGPRVAIGDGTISEGDAKNRSAGIYVALSQPAPVPTTVSYIVLPGTAGDFDAKLAAPKTLSFSLDQQIKVVPIPTTPDTIAEGDESVVVRLTSATGATITHDTGVVTIVDDDGPVPSPASPLYPGPLIGSWTPPSPLPPGQPGDVFWTDGVPNFGGSVAAISTARFMLYRSRTVRGADTAVSGWVITPNAPPPPGGYPVIAFAHGTTGLADNCAPTQSSVPNALSYLSSFVSAGYVVTATDYEGLGTPDPATYIAPESEAHALLDSVRAARALNPNVSNRVIIYGESQGGHAATATAELAPIYAPDIDVVGAVGSGAGVGIQPVLLTTEAFNQFRGFVMMALQGFDSAFGNKVASSYYLTSLGKYYLPTTLSTGCVNSIVQAFSTLDPTTLFLPGALTTPQTLPAPKGKLAALMPRSRVDLLKANAPILYVHGRQDPLVPPSLIPPFVNLQCGLGATIQLKWYDAGHVPVTAAQADVLSWIADRFNGTPPPTACGNVPLP